MHVRRSAEFRLVYDNGKRAGDAHLLIFLRHRTGEEFSHNESYDGARLGLSISRKHGSAVRRNRKRRRIREAFRLVQSQLLKGIDIVIVPRQRTDSTVDDYRQSILMLVRKLTRSYSGPSDF